MGRYWLKIDKKIASSQEDLSRTLDMYFDRTTFRLRSVQEFEFFWRVNIKKYKSQERKSAEIDKTP